MSNTVQHAYDVLKNLAEMDANGDLIFRGSAVDIIQAINALRDAERRLEILVQNAITVEYDDD